MIGPLPFWLCDLNLIFKGTLTIAFSFILTVIVIVKYLLLCVWKKMCINYDDLIVRVVVLSSVLISFLMYVAKLIGPGKPVQNKIICTGIFHPSFESMGKRFAPEAIGAGVAFLVNTVLMVPIFIQRRKNEGFDAKHGVTIPKRRVPVSLESLFWNFTYFAVQLPQLQ